MISPSIQLPETLRLLRQGIDEGLHLGGQLYVSLADGRCQTQVFGEHQPGQSMTADTLMIWLSASKPIAAVALAQLWEAGLLQLDDPLVRYLPEFSVYGKERITLRQVLTHTAGIRMLTTGWPEASWDEIIATICARRPEPRWTPGEKAGYHLSSSWFLLGEVIHRIDGRSFSDYVRQEIFEPLGMMDCWIGMPEQRFTGYDERIGRTYGTENGQRLERRWHNQANVTGCSPGGNGYGPLAELGRFYELLLGRDGSPPGTFEGRQLVSPQTVEALTTPQRVGMIDHTFKHRIDWGLGFIVNSEHYAVDTVPYGYGAHASRRTFGHSGFQSSTAFADPRWGLVVALAVNGNPGEVAHTLRFRRLTESIYEDLGLAPSDSASSVETAK